MKDRTYIQGLFSYKLVSYLIILIFVFVGAIYGPKVFRGDEYPKIKDVPVSEQVVGEKYEFSGTVTDSRDSSMVDGPHYIYIDDKYSVLVGGGWLLGLIDTYDTSIEIGDEVVVRALLEKPSEFQTVDARYTLYECSTCFVKKR